MHPNQSKLESRVRRAAEAALSRQKYVSAIDVLCGMGLLATPHVDDWRRGRVDFLERVIQANLSKISSSMAIFRRWAGEKGLKPSETGYVRHTRSGTMALQFSKSGDPGIEKSYRTHYVSPALSEKKQQRLQEKLNQSPNPSYSRTCARPNVRSAERRLNRVHFSRWNWSSRSAFDARVLTISSFFHRVTRR
jgi:hypothetical protein